LAGIVHPKNTQFSQLRKSDQDMQLSLSDFCPKKQLRQLSREMSMEDQKFKRPLKATLGTSASVTPKKYCKRKLQISDSTHSLKPSDTPKPEAVYSFGELEIARRMVKLMRDTDLPFDSAKYMKKYGDK